VIRKMRSLAALTSEDRYFLGDLLAGKPAYQVAKLLGVGPDTLNVLIDLYGRTTPETVERVHLRLEELRAQLGELGRAQLRKREEGQLREEGQPTLRASLGSVARKGSGS
jgi:hypothetical protein